MSGGLSEHDIDHVASLLRSAGVEAVDVFERKLTANARESKVSNDLLAEAEAALAFVRAGFQVRMDDCPDLMLWHSGQQLGGEVKHFRTKDQDRIDEHRLAEPSDLLVQYGDAVPLEGKTAWDQVVGVAITKAQKLEKGRPSLLVIVSDSSYCVDDLAVKTAADVLNESATRRVYPQLSVWNGLVLVSREYSVRHCRAVHFFELSPSAVQLLDPVRTAVKAVRL